VTTGQASTAQLHGPARLVPTGWPRFALPVIVGLVAVIWVAYVNPLVHFDVDVFLRAGAAVADGRDPYPQPGTPEVYSGFAFVYPYLMALPFVPLARLPHAGAETFIALSVLAVLGGAGLAGARRWRTFALVLVASCTITGLQMGTLNALLFAGLAALWRYRDRPAAAGVLAALLVYSKLFLFPLPLWLLLTGRYRATAFSAVALAALFGVGELVSPVGMTAYADMLGVLAREEAPDGLSLTGLLMNAGLGVTAATWLARSAAAALLAACWAGARRAADERLLFAGTVTAALVASPIVWSHYLLLLAVPLLVLAPERDGALATATAASWLLVTPHLSTTTDLVVSAVVLLLLVAGPLLDSARRVERPDRRRATRVALVSAGTAALGMALWSIAHTRGQDAGVIGAYLAFLGMVTVLGWSFERVGPARHPVGDERVSG
jgi:hypothetical protein